MLVLRILTNTCNETIYKVDNENKPITINIKCGMIRQKTIANLYSGKPVVPLLLYPILF